jgi:hypothetical protein
MKKTLRINQVNLLSTKNIASKFTGSYNCLIFNVLIFLAIELLKS